MAKKKELSRGDRISKEYERLKSLYKDMPKNILSLYEGLLERAAYMKVSLEDFEKDLNERGWVEQFSQSDKLEPYERNRPISQNYHTLNKNYQSIMKQLKDALPGESAHNESEEIMKYVTGLK